ncbi:MAG: dihydrolipoamide acetyltransferase family protein [Vulcanimicrobiaceae bacterium]
MPTTIKMPQLGETVTEGTVAQWLKKPGDRVEKYEAFVEVSTDKVNAEVPAPVSGVLREIIVSEGQTVPTGAPIAVIDEVGGAPGAEPVADAIMSVPATATHYAAAPVTQPAPAPSRATGGNGIGVSPAVRRLAREHSVDLARVRGSGANGRITAQDVMDAARSAPASPPRDGKASYTNPIPGTTIPLTQARKLIAQRMVESRRTAPHAWTTVEVDVTNLWKWRTREKDDFERRQGVRLTLLPFFIRAVVESLVAYPLMNASFADDGIKVHKDVNIGIAIALPDNLILPIIRNADKLSIKGLATAAGSLIERARRNQLTADDLSGGTFTVNNTGANGSVLSAPIIPNGQAGIVTMEAVVKRPVVVDGDAIAIRSMMNVCLSLDHRVVDGFIASAFVADVKKRLEAMGPSGTL